MGGIAGALAIGFGPLLVGMPFEEVTTAVPEAQWVAGDPYRFSGQPRRLSTAHGVRIAEVDFSARLSRGHHGQYSIGLEHAGAAADADDCERRARAVFLAVEAQTGPMASPGELIAHEYVEEIGARSQAKLSQTLDDAMRKPVPRAKPRGRQPARRWLRAEGLPNDSRPATTVNFAMDYRRDGSDACVIRLEAERPALAPAETPLALGELTTDRGPSIGLRHLLASRLLATGDLPETGVDAVFDCLLDRASGVLFGCAAAGTAPPPANAEEQTRRAVQRRALHGLATAYHFDLARVPGLDRDDPVPLLVSIPVRLHPGDVRSLQDTASAVPMKTAGFRWAQVARESTLERLYPTRALRAGEQSAVALVCRIEEDLSPVCAPVQQEPRPAPDFEWAALEILTHYRAQPQAVDGTSTIGRLVLQRLDFRLAD